MDVGTHGRSCPLPNRRREVAPYSLLAVVFLLVVGIHLLPFALGLLSFGFILFSGCGIDCQVEPVVELGAGKQGAKQLQRLSRSRKQRSRSGLTRIHGWVAGVERYPFAYAEQP